MKFNNRYFILRHGQTIYQGRRKNSIYPWPEKPPIKLIKKGEAQVRRSVKKIKNKGVDLIFASDFLRTKQSAEIAAKELGIKKINFDKRLREINLGIYRGKPKKELLSYFPDQREKRFTMPPPKGESKNQVKGRMLDFLREINKKYKGKNILIVSHGDPLWLLEGAIKKWPIEKFLKMPKSEYIKTGELREL